MFQTSIQMLRVMEAFEKRFENLERTLNDRLGTLETGYEKHSEEAKVRATEAQRIAEKQARAFEERLDFLQTSVNVLGVQNRHDAAKISRMTGRASSRLSRFLVDYEASHRCRRAVLESFISWGGSLQPKQKSHDGPPACGGVDVAASPAVPPWRAPSVPGITTPVEHHMPPTRRRRGRRLMLEAGSRSPERGAPNPPASLSAVEVSHGSLRSADIGRRGTIASMIADSNYWQFK